MESMQINPATIFTQAILSSLLAGTMTFVSSVVTNMVVQPFIHAVSQQIGAALTGGMKSLNNDDAPSLLALPSFAGRAPFPPFLFSITPEGQLNITIPMNEAMQNLMPFLSIPSQQGGE